MIRSPTRRVGYIEEEGMKRSSENVDHKRATTKNLKTPSRPGHLRKPQLWQGIHLSEGKVIKVLYKAHGLKKLIDPELQKIEKKKPGWSSQTLQILVPRLGKKRRKESGNGVYKRRFLWPGFPWRVRFNVERQRVEWCCQRLKFFLPTTNDNLTSRLLV